MIGPFPLADAGWQALLARAARGVGRLTREGDRVVFADPDTGVRATFTHRGGLWVDLPLPAPRGAAVEVAEVVASWPRSLRPALADGADWTTEGFLARFLPAARAAVAGAGLAVAEDATCALAWAWNQGRWERQALYDDRAVAPAWLVRVGDRVTTAAVWTRGVRTLVPPVELLLVVPGGAGGAPAVGVLALALLLPLVEEVDGGAMLDASTEADPRAAAALATAVDASGITRLPLTSVVERSLASPAC